MSTPVEQIKERLSIEDVVSSYVKLERAGKNLKAKCPFHNEKTPSFYISPDRGTYYCFGCGAKGDIFSFVQQFEGLDFPGALKLLAERAGVELKYDRNAANSAQLKSEKEKLYAIMEEATIFFERGLAEGKGHEAVHDYLKKRGLTDATVKEFRIGFVPDEWRLLYSHLKEKGWSDSDIEKAGLAKRPDAGDAPAAGANGAAGVSAPKALYDRFRGRVMFPIGDSSGRIIAFSGRILHDDGKSAKYLNSPDTPLYTKSTVLYGLDKAKQAIRTLGYSIFVEGQMDLVMSHQAGIKNTVAVSGTALADTTITRDTVVNNLGIVRRLSPNVIFAFDSDAAGRKAAMRSAQIALALDMDVKIATMTEGKDPADMILANPDLWRNALRTAKPVIEFLIDGVLADMSGESNKSKTGAAHKKVDERKIAPMLVERVYPFIAALSSQTTQALYVKMVRDRIFANSVTEDFIWNDIREIRKKMQAEIVKAQAGPGTGQSQGQNGIVSGTATGSRLDIISRKLFGLLAYLAREKTLATDGIYAAIKTVAGDERYNNLIQGTQPSLDELTLEAELFFGQETKKEKMQKIVDEMLLNFEEDVLKEDFADTMATIGRLEKTAKQSDAQTLMEKCNMLSLRLADISKKREEAMGMV
jgi:DNA primase